MPNGGSGRTITTRLTLDPSGYVTGVSVAESATSRFSRNSSRNLSQLTSEFNTLGTAVAASGAAIAAGLGLATRSAFQFEAELTKSVTLIGISREEMDEMGQAALGLSDTGQGPQTLAESLFFVQSAGLRGATALDTAKSAAKAASIGLGDTATIADLTTSAMNAYGSATLDSSAATDVLVGAVREGKAEAPELASSMGRVLPIASEMGVSFDEVGAAIAAMTRTGTDAATSTTQLRAILTSLLNPAQQSEEALTELGLSSEELRNKIQQDGLWAAMELLRNTIGDNQAALGKIIPNVRALAGFLDLTGSNASENAQIFERMADTTGLADEAFEEWSETTEASVARFKASVESAAIALGQNLLPALEFLANIGTTLAQSFTGLPSELQSVIAITAALTSGVALLTGGFLLLLPRIISTRAAMDALALSAPRAARGLSLLGKAAGVASALLLAVSAIQALNAATGETPAGVGEITNSLLELSDGIESEFINSLQDLHSEIVKERQALQDAANSWTEYKDSFAGTELDDIIAGNKEFAEQISAVDEALAQMVAGGNIEEADESVQALAEALGLSDDETEKLTNNLPAYKDALDQAAAQQKLTEESSGELTDEIEGQDQAVSDLEEQLQSYLDTLKAATDPVFALESALRTVEDAEISNKDAVRELERAEEDLIKLRESGEASARELEDAELRVRDAQREVRRSSFNVAEALVELETAALNGELSFDQFDQKLKDWVDQGRITGGQADDIRGRVKKLRGEAENYRGDYEAKMIAETREAEQAIGRLLSGLGDIEGEYKATVNIGATGLNVGRFFSGAGLAEGGEVKGPGGPTDDSAGMYALSNGEWVVRASSAQRYGPQVMKAINDGTAEIIGGPDDPFVRVQINANSRFNPADLEASDFRDGMTAVASLLSGSVSGRVLPAGSYRIGRGTAGHGYPALDLPAPTGTPVYSVAAGIVSRALRLGYSYGVHAFINHAGGRQSRYAHLSSLLVGAGQEVGRGQLIGRVGSTGNSTGPHLHYEDLINGRRRSPAALGIFDRGGIWPSGTIGLNASGRDEMVLPPEVTEMFRRIATGLSRMPASRPVPYTQSTPGSADGGVTVQSMTVQAWSDRFSLRQIQNELSLHGSI